jgi:putative oxidoreductase
MARIARYVLGLLFALSGVAGLLGLVQPPPDLPEAMTTFMNGLMATKYFFPFLKLTETVCGVMLLLGIAPAFALVVLAPITVNIFLLHAFVTPGLGNLVLPGILAALHIVCGSHYWNRYTSLFARA